MKVLLPFFLLSRLPSSHFYTSWEAGRKKKSGCEIILGLSGISTVILKSVQEVAGLELSELS